ncbi:hypothetical protein GX50_00907 [[Emmonsia] crescens]|uniref:Uncharacterized protein n=1 Tax=[Emmonsia] crescens TaxID=73230 RepID=A0A2B7ZSP4_9EURO|nr:hypothetical protein GX50_00907 [Emmonsia crescens]
MSAKRGNSSSDPSDGSASTATPMSCVSPPDNSPFSGTLDTVLEKTVPFGPNHLFWSSEDRTGEKGCLDRHKRKRRLTKSITLNAEQLRDVLDFVADNQNEEGYVQWTDEIVFRYVPHVFEGAIVPFKTAADVLHSAISKAFFRIFHSVYEEGLTFYGNPKRFFYELFWYGAEPVVPEILRNTPIFSLIEREPERIHLQAVQAGAGITSLAVENLNSGPIRHVTLSYVCKLDGGDVGIFVLKVQWDSPNRCPGDLKESWKWGSDWETTEKWTDCTEYAQVLSQVNFYMKQYNVRYGFVLTDTELVPIRRLDERE